MQRALNEAGQAAMVPMIKQFDTHGEPIRVNGVTGRDALAGGEGGGPWVNG